jgi:hypothetical protein
LKRKLDAYLMVFQVRSSHYTSSGLADEQLYVTCKVEIPMDVEFMLSDTLEVGRVE